MPGFDTDSVGGGGTLYATNVDFTGNSLTAGFPQMVANGQLLIGSAVSPRIRAGMLTAGTGINITNGAGSITIASTASLTDLHTARYIVASSTNGTGANFTSIASAIAAAQGSGVSSTVFIQPGTYTENLTMVAGINLCAFTCDAFTPNVTINGTCTLTTAGSVTITGIRLQTNSAAFLAVTGSAASIVELRDCYLNCSNNSGITFSSSSGSSAINIINCKGDLGTTGIKLFACTGSGSLDIFYSYITNSGSSTTASTSSSGTLNIWYCYLNFGITTSSTSGGQFLYTIFDTLVLNTTSFTAGGSGVQSFEWCTFNSGTASAVSCGSATVNLTYCNANSSNTNAITGAGTLTQSLLTFGGTSSTVNTSTQVASPVSKIYSPSGITFDNSNTLSIFSQGTFTPTIQGSSVAGTIGAYGTQTGRYQKVGRIVTASVVVSWTTIGAATGSAQILGLPFTVVNNAGSNVPNFATAGGGAVLTTVSGGVPFLQVNLNATTANLDYYLGSTGQNLAGTITASNGIASQMVYETV